MADRVAYPANMEEAAQKIAVAALGIIDRMNTLNSNHQALLQLSTGATATGFMEVQRAWSSSGLTNAGKFQAVAGAVKDAKMDIDEWDRVMQGKFLAGP